MLVRAYWTELADGLAEVGVPVRHFVLYADRAHLTRRIEQDTAEIRTWRLDHIADYEDALPWLREAGGIVDTVGVPLADAAHRIAAAVG